MSKGFLERIGDIGTAGPAVTNSTIATSLFTDGEKPTLAAKYFERIGKGIIFRGSGRISTLVTTPGTLQLDFKLGTIVVASSLPIPLNVVSKVNVHWLTALKLVCRSIGSGTNGKLITGSWEFISEAVIGSPLPTVGGSGVLLLPFNTVPAVGNGFDTTVSNQFDIVATWSVASTSNSITMDTVSVDQWS